MKREKTGNTVILSAKRLFRFLTHGIWHINIEEQFRGIARFFILQYQMLVLEIRLFFRNHSVSWAAGLSFTTLLSLIPLLTVVFMGVKAFGGTSLLNDKLKPVIYRFLNPGAGGKLSNYLDRMLKSASVETLGIIGFLFLLLSVYLILFSIEEAFNRIWKVQGNRGPVEQVRTYLALVVLVPVVTVLSVSLSSAYLTPNLGSFFRFVFESTLPVLFIFLLFLLLLKSMPNCRVETRKAMTGAVWGTALTLITKEGFFFYTRLAVSTNVIYGSLALLPFLMLWIFSFWLIVLFSVHIVYVRHNLKSLRALEIQTDTNRADQIRITIAAALEILRNFLEGGKGITLTEIQEQTASPSPDVRRALFDMEKGGIITRRADGDGIYLPAIPVRDFTIKSVMHCVDRMYLPNRTDNLSGCCRKLDKLLEGSRLAPGADPETPLEDLLEKTGRKRTRTRPQG